MIRVLINGALGKMGRVTTEAIAHEADLQLVAATTRTDVLNEAIRKYKPQVVVDFTTPHSVFDNTKIIIAEGVHPVIGTTGLTTEQIATLTTQCAAQSLGGIIAPNFSLGAVLMMKYAQDAARYLPDMEIIEMHHPKKLDAPSGTALKTAHMIEEIRKSDTTRKPIPIHSVRLPGLFAHQMVIFGGTGETLTIRHDATDRNAMMPGVFLACRKVMKLKHLVYGLEKII